MQKVKDSVKSQGWLSRTLYNIAFAQKRRNLARNIVEHRFWDWLVFYRIRERMGGRVRLMVSGAAPLREEVLACFPLFDEMC